MLLEFLFWQKNQQISLYDLNDKYHILTATGTQAAARIRGDTWWLSRYFFHLLHLLKKKKKKSKQILKCRSGTGRKQEPSGGKRGNLSCYQSKQGFSIVTCGIHSVSKLWMLFFCLIYFRLVNHGQLWETQHSTTWIWDLIPLILQLPGMMGLLNRVFHRLTMHVCTWVSETVRYKNASSCILVA